MSVPFVVHKLSVLAVARPPVVRRALEFTNAGRFALIAHGQNNHRNHAFVFPAIRFFSTEEKSKTTPTAAAEASGLPSASPLLNGVPLQAGVIKQTASPRKQPLTPVTTVHRNVPKKFVSNADKDVAKAEKVVNKAEKAVASFEKVTAEVMHSGDGLKRDKAQAALAVARAGLAVAKAELRVAEAARDGNAATLAVARAGLVVANAELRVAEVARNGDAATLAIAEAKLAVANVELRVAEAARNGDAATLAVARAGLAVAKAELRVAEVARDGDAATLAVARAGLTVSKAELRVAEVVRDGDSATLAVAEAELRVAEAARDGDAATLAVARADLIVARAELAVAKAERGNDKGMLTFARNRLEKARASRSNFFAPEGPTAALSALTGVRGPGTPLRNNDLDDVKWKTPKAPRAIHELQPRFDIKLKLSKAGELVQYLPPPSSFDDAYLHVTSACSSGGASRKYYKVFIDGPSGSGKTRMGWELYRKLAASSLANSTSYVYVNMSDEVFSESSSEADIKDWLAGCIVKQLAGIEKSEVSLKAVLASLLGIDNDCDSGQCGALVLHVDEFHRKSTATLRLLSAVRQFSEDNPSTLILPVCTGLYTDPSFEPGKTSGNVHRVILSYFRTPQESWSLVQRAAKAFIDDDLPAWMDKCDIDGLPPNIRYLVEDTCGWPMAAVQLGVNMFVHGRLFDENPEYLSSPDGTVRKTLPHANPSTLAAVEEAVASQLKFIYKPDVLRSSMGIGEHALLKVATLALSPFSVDLGEPLSDGVTVKDIRTYGIVDDQPIKNSTRARLRISKPLLRIIVESERVLEAILTGVPEELPSNALPVKSKNLLRTCRPYDADTQEAVQIVSYLVAIHAWLLMEKRPKLPSLLTFRPGAHVLGNREIAEEEMRSLTEAANAVDAAGDKLVGVERTQARQNMAYEVGLRLVARTKDAPLLPGTAALLNRGAAGNDMQVSFQEGKLVGQCKGRTTGPAAGTEGGDETVGQKEATDHVERMRKYANKDTHRFELLLVGRAPGLAKMSASETPISPEASGAKKPKSSEASGADWCAIVISHENLQQALGFEFGGIAARCQDQN